MLAWFPKARELMKSPHVEVRKVLLLGLDIPGVTASHPCFETPWSLQNAGRSRHQPSLDQKPRQKDSDGLLLLVLQDSIDVDIFTGRVVYVFYWR